MSVRAIAIGWLGFLLLSVWTSLAVAEAEPDFGFLGHRWSNASALLLQKGHGELGTSSCSRWGVSDSLQLGVHPIVFWFSPRIELKAGWLKPRPTEQAFATQKGWALSTLHALSYPTRFLQVVSKKGSLGLLPENTRVPFSLQLDTELILSRYQKGHVFGVSAALQMAPHATSHVPLLDFPFLYQRFAPYFSPVVSSLALHGTGPVFRGWGYEVKSRFFYLPIVSGHGVRRAWAVESALRVHLAFARRHRVSLGALLSTAEYPIGVRTHLLPTLDYRLALF